eukprot:365751-Chlamydomonas_euryale.AAC.8
MERECMLHRHACTCNRPCALPCKAACAAAAAPAASRRDVDADSDACVGEHDVRAAGRRVDATSASVVSSAKAAAAVGATSGFPVSDRQMQLRCTAAPAAVEPRRLPALLPRPSGGRKWRERPRRGCAEEAVHFAGRRSTIDRRSIPPPKPGLGAARQPVPGPAWCGEAASS